MRNNIAPNIDPSSCVRFTAIKLVAFLFACFAPNGAASESPELPNVVATTSIIGDAASRIGDGLFSVTTLMGEGVDPHLYKASPGDMRALSNATLVLHNGLHLEGKISEILSKLSERKAVVAVTRSIPINRLRVTADFPDAPDPHVWFDPALWSYAVTEIGTALSAIAPQKAAIIDERTRLLKAELVGLDTEVKATIDSIPKELRVLVTAHDAFGYFGMKYGLEVLSIQGMSTDSEASLYEINSLIRTITLKRIPAVFVESSVSEKNVEAIVQGCAARGHNIIIGGQLYSDALGRQGTPEGTLIGALRHNATVIASALRTLPRKDPQ
jgi:manganese/zinc/iron transport system substrate-binding protein